MSTVRNEGEGNKTAAREFNERQRRFVRSGKVAAAARDAERALDGRERDELLKAEAAGKDRAAPEPEADEQKIRERAHAIWEREGCPDGKQDDHWHRAARELADETAR